MSQNVGAVFLTHVQNDGSGHLWDAVQRYREQPFREDSRDAWTMYDQLWARFCVLRFAT